MNVLQQTTPHSHNCTFLQKKLDHKSPLIRSAAANAMISNPRPEPIMKLLNAAKDKYRVVRLAAASSLSVVPIYQFTIEEKQIVENVLEEYKNSLVTRPDDWSSHYNLGNFYHYQGQLNKAILSYKTAGRLYDPFCISGIDQGFRSRYESA